MWSTALPFPLTQETRLMQRRVRRAMALTTLYVAMVCAPAGPAVAELGDPDPGGGNATTSTTVDTPPTTEPPSDSTTTTTTTISDPSTTTTTVPADDAAPRPRLHVHPHPHDRPGPFHHEYVHPVPGWNGPIDNHHPAVVHDDDGTGLDGHHRSGALPRRGGGDRRHRRGRKPRRDGSGSGGSSSSGRSGRTHPSLPDPPREGRRDDCRKSPRPATPGYPVPPGSIQRVSAVCSVSGRLPTRSRLA